MVVIYCIAPSCANGDGCSYDFCVTVVQFYIFVRPCKRHIKVCQIQIQIQKVIQTEGDSETEGDTEAEGVTEAEGDKVAEGDTEAKEETS